jgi:hypothetical protein
MYSVVTTWSVHDFLPDFNPLTIEAEVTDLGDGSFSVADFSGGLWPGKYNDEYGPLPNGGNFALVFNEICNNVSWSGQVEQWGDILMDSNGPNAVDPETGVISISFTCPAWGETATSVYTPL